ncbi:MAG: hypothetical protein ABIH34_04440 [Nanoarchaeota archaeon]
MSDMMMLLFGILLVAVGIAALFYWSSARKQKRKHSAVYFIIGSFLILIGLSVLFG